MGVRDKQMPESGCSSEMDRQQENFPKMLLLCRNIPPAPTGASVVTGNLARQFSSREMVVMGSYYLRTPPQTWAKQWPKLKYAMVQVPDGWRGARWLKWGQLPLLFIRAMWTVLMSRCRAIMVVFPDEVFLLVAYLVARITRRPVYPYLHNCYLENRPNDRLASWLQPRLFAIAPHVFVMSEGMLKLYRTNYPGLSCSPLLHSFNQPIPEVDSQPSPIHKPLHLVTFGNVGPSNAEASTRLAEFVRTSPDVELTVFSGTSRSYLKKVGFYGDNVVVKTVSYDDLMNGLRNSDMVLLPHGFFGECADEEIDTIFPTRTIEALLCERPIIAHTPANCFFADFLRKHGCALIVDEPEIGALRAAVHELRDNPALRSQLVQNALLAARQFQASSVAEHLRSVASENLLGTLTPQAVGGRG